jgi:Tol biopolymer transport system component
MVKPFWPAALLVCTAAALPPDSLVAQGEISSPAAEVRLAFSPDGRQVLWGSIGREAAPDQQDIWERHRVAGGWSAPARVSFDTQAVEFDPAFSPDGRNVYFHSDRPGGFGGTDLYKVSRDPNSLRFGTPVNLGPTVNSKGDEWAPTPLRDGSLIFSSDGWGGFGGHDILVLHPGARRPANPGAAINGPDEDFDAALSPDGSLLVFSSGTMSDDAANVRLFSARWRGGHPDARTPLGVGCSDFVIGTSFDPREPHVIFYAAHCAGGLGRMDMWQHDFGSGTGIR